MFKREMNPNLFDFLSVYCSEVYGEKIFGENWKSYESVLVNGEIPDEMLNNITYLDIPVAQYDIRSLEGIQNLTNLQSIKIVGIDEYQALSKYGKCNPDDLGILESKLESYVRRGQIKDITPLYSCKNLTYLDLSNQRGITEVDLSQWPYLDDLKMNSCTSLSKVVGLQNTESLKRLSNSPFDSVSLDLRGCDTLKLVEGLPQFARKLATRPDNLLSTLYLPINTYVFMSNNPNSGLAEFSSIISNLPNSNCVLWSDNADYLNLEEGALTTQQAEILKARIDTIIDTVCKDSNADLQNIYNIYKWITHNVEYDFHGLNFEKSGGLSIFDRMQSFVRKVAENSDDFKKLDKKLSSGYQKISKLVNWDPIASRREAAKNKLDKSTNTLRTSYDTFFNKKGVCAGISNLFNIMLADIGIVSESSYCATVFKDKDNKSQIELHQISSCKLKAKDSKGRMVTARYFFDPTWDLWRENPKFFGMTRLEIEKTHYLNPIHSATPIGLSMQHIVRKLENSSAVIKNHSIGARVRKMQRDKSKELEKKFSKYMDSLKIFDQNSTRRDFKDNWQNNNFRSSGEQDSQRLQGNPLQNGQQIQGEVPLDRLSNSNENGKDGNGTVASTQNGAQVEQSSSYQEEAMCR